ncbi:hypothetical protein Tco_0994967 [Tanacetum coccineum]
MGSTVYAKFVPVEHEDITSIGKSDVKWELTIEMIISLDWLHYVKRRLCRCLKLPEILQEECRSVVDGSLSP